MERLRSVASAFDGRGLEPQSRGAWRRLSAVESYGGVTDVWTWGPTDSASDAVTLWGAGERDALVHLALEAAPGGRLWAMRALRDCDSAAFEALSKALMADRTVLTQLSGCIASESTIGELMQGVAEDDELWRAYANRFTEPAELEATLEWSRNARDSGHWYLRDELAAAAALRLDQATWVGDAGELARDLDTLLEREAFPMRAACMLAVAPRPEARFWGAKALRRLTPVAFEALLPYWERDLTPLACQAQCGSKEHTLAQALALHAD